MEKIKNTLERILSGVIISLALSNYGCYKERESEQERAEVVRVEEAPHKNLHRRPKNKETLYQTLVRHEGRRNFTYIDTRRNRTIGVGFNLERADARGLIESLGLNYERVLKGKQGLSDEQIDYLLRRDIETATEDAKKYLGESYDNIDGEAREIIINMAFNLGYPKLSKFKNLRRALIYKDYNSAANEMLDSKWYTQVGRRSRELAERMKSISQTSY